MSRSIKVSHKSSEIFTVILPVFKASMNLAHIKYLSMLLGALCTVQTVCLSKLAGAFGNKASRESYFRRIQRFMAQLALDFDVVAEYLRSRIPLDGPYTLTMDRTNWKLGELNINALVLGIAYDHMSFPILFRLRPNGGTPITRKGLISCSGSSGRSAGAASNALSLTVSSSDSNGSSGSTITPSSIISASGTTSGWKTRGSPSLLQGKMDH